MEGVEHNLTGSSTQNPNSRDPEKGKENYYWIKSLHKQTCMTETKENELSLLLQDE